MFGRARALAAVLIGLGGTPLAIACGGSPGNPLLGSPDGSASGSVPKGAACTPGQQVSCACPGENAGGVQVCNADGTGLGPCVGCAGASSSGNSGSSSGNSGSGSGNSGSSSGNSGSSSGSSGSGSGGSSGGDGGVLTVQCDAGAKTTITGTVYDPAAVNPLYGVSVYVPRSKPAALPTGVTCSCDGLYPLDPITTTQTDASGKFTLPNVPDQTSVPLVLQIGKWRTQLTVPITPCQTNALTDKSLTLPKNHTAGDIPQIAVSTGAADSLECLLSRVGLDASEYTGGAGGAGHIHIFQGGGTGTLGAGAPNTSPAGPASSTALWDTSADLMNYDMVFLSCEGDETGSMNQPALFDYAAAGGRVFASHFHYAWFNTGPFAAKNMATWTTGTNAIGNVNASLVTTLPAGGTFVKGAALASWLGGLGVLSGGQLPEQYACQNAQVTSANAPSQAWLTTSQDDGGVPATQYFSFNTSTLPDAGAPRECGRVIYSDIHVGAASNDYGGNLGLTTDVVPTGCAAGPLSPQEDALEFMLFDLSSCVTPDE
jgi:hypothetical protein